MFDGWAVVFAPSACLLTSSVRRAIPSTGLFVYGPSVSMPRGVLRAPVVPDHHLAMTSIYKGLHILLMSLVHESAGQLVPAAEYSGFWHAVSRRCTSWARGGFCGALRSYFTIA